MSTAYKSLIAAAALSLVTACDPEEFGSAADDAVEFRCHWSNPLCQDTSNTPFTGLVIGISLLDTTGAEHEGTEVHKLTLAGGIGVADKFWADQGQLFAKKGTTVYSGFGLLGAAFSLTVNGVPLVLRITDVDAPALGHLYWRYVFSYQTDDMVQEGPACIPTGADDFGAVVQRDVDVDGTTGDITYRANTVFIACLRGAMGEISYEPLGYGFRPFELGLTAFEAATDMLRANYCDDGTAWTKYGNQLAQQNKWNIGNDVLNGHLDAVWGMDGAVCLGESLRGGRSYDDIVCDNKPPKCTDAEGLTMYQQTDARFITHAF